MVGVSGSLDKRRAAVAAAWGLADEIVLVGSGRPPPIVGTDQFYEFRVHPEYRYLADADGSGEVLAFDPRSGWTRFVPVLSADDLVWHGGHAPDGTPLSELADWLDAREGRPIARLGAAVEGVDTDRALSKRLSAAVTAARLVKDADEQARMRAAAAATRAGFLTAMKEARPGLTERQLEAELEAGFLRAGAPRPAFDSIVAAGTNAAVLHFQPTNRQLKTGQLLLIDAGAEADGYACDCTRTFVVGGRPNAEQNALHQLVREVQEAAVARCVPGAEYREIHLGALEQMTQGLVDFGLLRGKIEGLMDYGVGTLFFPHGIGHLLGLAVHDPGGYAEGRSPSDAPGLKWLRADRPLQAGMAVTIEPGLYFIPALLEDPGVRERFAVVDWTRVDAMLEFGGIRIEDTVLVTDGDPEVLTGDIPKGLVVS